MLRPYIRSDEDKLMLNGVRITDTSHGEPVTVMANHMAIKRSARLILNPGVEREAFRYSGGGVGRRLLGGVGSSSSQL